MAAGMLLLLASLIRRNDVPHTTLRDQRLLMRDWICLVLFVLGVMAFAVPALFGANASMAWSPYPALTVPAFDVLLGVALLFFIAPVVNRSSTE